MGRQLARVHVGSFTTEHRAALVKVLAELAPGDLNRTQLYSSGAEAVEAALRLAKSRTGHTEVIGFWGGFHGKTGGVLPVLGSNFKHALGPLMPGTYLSPYAACARCVFDKTFPSCEWHCVEFLRQKIAIETTNDVAAIVVEPIQGTAGNVVPPPGYLRMLRHLADEVGALLICDEMLTGFGRTGKMFAIEHEQGVSDVRGRGLMIGMELVVPGTRQLLNKKVTRRIFDALLARGVLAMIYNPEVRINPPLVISEDQAMTALAILKEVLGEAAQRPVA